VRTWWDENLFVAGYLRASLTRGAPDPKLVVMDAGGFVPVHGPRHPGRIPPPGPRASAKVIAAYVASLKSVAGDENAHVVGVEIVRPGPIGVAVTLRVGDPARFLKHRLDGVLTTFNNWPEGILAGYLGVYGPTGKLVFATGRLPTGGSVYIDPKLRGCPQLGMPGVPGMKIPPCPAK
jgi:hypothetical protein